MSWWSKILRKPHGEGAEGPAVRGARSLPRPPLIKGSSPRTKLPRFSGYANDGLARPSSGADPRRLRLRAAFHPSQPVLEANLFAGRREVLADLIRAVEDLQLHAVIYGDRGIGKTSLLHVFSQLAREAKYIVRYTSCSESSEFDEIFPAIAAEIPLLFHRDLDPTSEAAEQGGTLADLIGDHPVTVSLATELLSKLAGTRVLLILDEYDRTTSEAFRKSIAELIKNLSDRGSRVQLVIAGVAENLAELLEHIPSVRRNVTGIPLGPMPRQEVEQLIRNAEAASAIQFEEFARDVLVSAASGSPYVTNLLGQHAAIEALDRGAMAVSVNDVSSAIARAVAELSLRLSADARRRVAVARQRLSNAAVAALARAALDNYGRIEAATLPSEGGADILGVAKAAGLIVPLADASSGAFRFVDDGAPLYLWLESVQHGSGPRKP